MVLVDSGWNCIKCVNVHGADELGFGAGKRSLDVMRTEVFVCLEGEWVWRSHRCRANDSNDGWYSA